jgi:hypothetical protein
MISADTPKYFRRYRLCEAHLRADAVLVAGVPSRFCQARARAAAHARAPACVFCLSR